MTAVVKNMDRAMQDMNLEKISMVMDRFEGQFEDLDVQTGYMEGSMGKDMAVNAPADQVDLLMQQVADEAGLEIQHELAHGDAQRVPELKTPQGVNEEQEDALVSPLPLRAGLSLTRRAGPGATFACSSSSYVIISCFRIYEMYDSRRVRKWVNVLEASTVGHIFR
jgi:hypothetical protein